MKKILVILTVIIIGIGACQMFNKETLTKEQQDNVVKRILRTYDIQSIDFIKFSKDQKTGSYHLIYIINNEEKYRTGLTVNQIERFNNSNDNIGMSPVDIFDQFKRTSTIEDIENEFKKVKVIYLKE